MARSRGIWVLAMSCTILITWLGKSWAGGGEDHRPAQLLSVAMGKPLVTIKAVREDLSVYRRVSPRLDSDLLTTSALYPPAGKWN